MEKTDARLELVVKNEQELIEKFDLTKEDQDFLHKIIENDGRPAICDKQSILEMFDVSDEECVTDIFFDAPDCFRLLSDKKNYLFDYSLAYMSTRGDDLDFRKIAMAEMHFVPFCKRKKEIKEAFNISEEDFKDYVKTGLLEHWCYSPQLDFAFYIMTESFRDMYNKDDE